MVGPLQLAVLRAIAESPETAHARGITDLVQKKYMRTAFMPQVRQAMNKLKDREMIRHEGESYNKVSGMFSKLYVLTEIGVKEVKEATMRIPE